MHDAVVTDCVPDGLIYGDVVTSPTPPVGTIVTVPGDGTNGCETGGTLLTWTLDTAVDGGASEFLRYTATVEDVAAGGVTYTNRANLTASTIADSQNDSDTERVFTDSALSRVGVGVPSVSKTASPETVTFGERATFTVVIGVFPKEINFFDSSIIDVLPDGFDPDSVELVDDQTQCSARTALPASADRSCALRALRRSSPVGQPSSDGGSVTSPPPRSRRPSRSSTPRC